jgi:hypothetical protein
MDRRLPVRQVQDWSVMGVREDCRHYSSRTTPSGEVMQRCRLGVNEEMPFACPDGCLFFEPRSVSDTGWQLGDPDEDR